MFQAARHHPYVLLHSGVLLRGAPSALISRKDSSRTAIQRRIAEPAPKHAAKQMWEEYAEDRRLDMTRTRDGNTYEVLVRQTPRRPRRLTDRTLDAGEVLY
jgi:hypothetical protein